MSSTALILTILIVIAIYIIFVLVFYRPRPIQVAHNQQIERLIEKIPVIKEKKVYQWVFPLGQSVTFGNSKTGTIITRLPPMTAKSGLVYRVYISESDSTEFVSQRDLLKSNTPIIK